MKPRQHEATGLNNPAHGDGSEDRGHSDQNAWPESNWGEGAASAYTAMQRRDSGHRVARPREDERPNSH